MLNIPSEAGIYEMSIPLPQPHVPISVKEELKIYHLDYNLMMT
jgi:hypothetical protein